MNRRTAIVAAVAAVAGAAGVGGAWWREHRRDGERPSAATAPTAVADFWTQRFDQPAGGELVLANFKGQALLLNFWATWCPPCVTEMPLLDRFHAEQRPRGWQVVGLAVDSPTPVRQFLARQPMGFPIGLAGLNGIELARSLGNPSGALPFSVVFDRSGQPVRTKLGSVHESDLADWVSALG
ncbi:MAG: redoxin [Methylibium sp. NZG]|nr:MAG: redoxin [Methylibium sp. NZG]